MVQRTTVKVDGFRELEDALRELPTALARNTGKRAMLKAAEPMVAKAKSLVPVRTGALRDSITAKAAVVNRLGLREFGQVMRATGDKSAARQALRDARRGKGSSGTVQVKLGPGQLPHAHLVEFGSVHNEPPHPYLRPAFDTEVGAVIDTVGDILRVEIAKTAARLEKRAARLAKKG